MQDVHGVFKKVIEEYTNLGVSSAMCTVYKKLMQPNLTCVVPHNICITSISNAR